MSAPASKWIRSGGVEVLAWIFVAPAALAVFAYPDLLRLILGAFGPPPRVSLGRSLMIGIVLATLALWGYRSRAGAPQRKRSVIRAGFLLAVALIAYGVVIARGRGFTTRNVVFPGPGISIAATVYKPDQPGRYRAILLVPGSAPFKRGFYSLWAEHIARRGVVAVVPDKRGVGGTGGVFERNDNSSRANLELLAGDVVASLDFTAGLDIVDSTCVGMLGFSQAGWVAPIAATRSSRAKFLMMVTAPAVSVREENVWSNLRGDDHQAAKLGFAGAEAVMDTVTPRGVDARASLAQLSLPELWLFGRDDNSIPTRRSVAVLDSLRSEGKPIESHSFSTGHVLFTRNGGLLPHFADQGWAVLDSWLDRRPGCSAEVVPG